MSKRGRPPLPEAAKKVRVEVYAQTEVVDSAHVIALKHGTTLSELTERYYRRLAELHRPQKSSKDAAEALST